MCEIRLVNMPFAALQTPSLALTQLKAVMHARHGDRVRVEICYLNQDFARAMGVDFYGHMATSMEAQNSGLGEWFFRQVAFPHVPDNATRYLQRYMPRRDEHTETLKRTLLAERQGIDRVLDNLIDAYRLDQAHVVGLTSTFFQNAASFAMARRLKERNPEVVTVMGGANCETPMGEEIIRNVEAIDFVFSGPALKSFPEFVQCLLNEDVATCHRIDGVLSRNNCEAGRAGMAGSIGQDLDIDADVRPDYDTFLDTFEANFPKGNLRPTLLLETSRGCWWGERLHCTFCGLNGTALAFRAMSPPLAIEQFESLFQYASRCGEFACVDNIMPKHYLQEVLPSLSPPPDASIFYETRADLSADEVRILSKAGVKRIQPGIESLATSVLKLMRKGTTAFQNLTLLKHCRMHDVHPSWNLLIGFPGEEEAVYEKYMRDIPLLTHLAPPVGVFPVRFDRYSPYFVEAEQYGLDLRPYDFYGLVYPFREDALTNLAYYFMDNNFSAPYFTTMAKWIGKLREQVGPWQRRWEDEDHATRPSLVIRHNDGPTIVYDSRPDEPVEHELGDTGRQILEQLSTPRKLAGLAQALPHVPDAQLDEELALLRDRGLIFEEGDRLMSLVLTDANTAGDGRPAR